MSFVLNELERVEQRVLGALRCIDATTNAQIDDALQVTIAGARVLRNRSGRFVVQSADALAAHADAFAAPPATPAVGSVVLTASIVDPAGRYLSRLVAVALPRDPAPANATQPTSLFHTLDVPLYPASSAATGANWACLRVSLHEQSSGDALGGALLRVTQGGNVLARGMSDWRGEALVCVPGVPVTTWSDDPHAVVVSEISVQLEAIFDAASGVRTPAANVSAGEPPATLPQVDPDLLEANSSTLPHTTQALLIASGRAQTLSLALALP